jgi:catechol 2,3-dioxygenase-like lactoylglutathione lyase family enzyme
MALELLEHFTIRCKDMDATRDFYRDVLGFPVGPRPPLKFAGYWLYCGNTPTVHLVKADDPTALESSATLVGMELAMAPTGKRTGALDHIAFRGADPDEMMERLDRMKIRYEHNVATGGSLRQIFLQDPNSVIIELNYPNQDPAKSAHFMKPKKESAPAAE